MREDQDVASRQEARPQQATTVSHTPGPWMVVCTNPAAKNPHMGWWDVETESGFIVAASLTLADATAVAALPDLMQAAVLLETAEDFNANDCDECGGDGVPELCPKCFPLFDDARVTRRAAIAKASQPSGEPA